MSSFIGDPDQQKVIALDGDYHLALAPPGCGKTTILAEHIIHAHSVGKDYRDMICLTFTNRASREIGNASLRVRAIPFRATFCGKPFLSCHSVSFFSTCPLFCDAICL